MTVRFHPDDEAVEVVRRNPEMYPKVHFQKRRAIVRRFPYCIYYEFEENELRILSVFHSSRNPETWQSRML